ncbi:MAG: tripartite tricarboxylate transporter substrate binding protein [Burkholderiaceae bacterium]
MIFRKLLSALALSLLALSGAHAADYPDRPVTLVVPFPAGGSSDTVARALGQKLQGYLGQSFVVENRAGAAGTIAAAQVKRAPADGYTLLVSPLGPFVIAPHLLKSVQYDPAKDFDLLTVAVQSPNVLVVHPSSPFQNVADLVGHLKKNPGRYAFASGGNGTSDHLTAELFWRQTGTSGLHVPYKGGTPAISDVIAGQVDSSFQNINAVIKHIQAGKLKALAMTGSQRSSLLPRVPTLAEAGVKNVVVYSWQAVAAPRGLPVDVKARLHQGLMAALRDPTVKQQMTDLGFEIVANTPAQFTAYQAEEFARWKTVIDDARITAE